VLFCWPLRYLRTSRPGLRPPRCSRGPYPVLVLSGEQGTAKSTFSAILRSLLSPDRLRCMRCSALHSRQASRCSIAEGLAGLQAVCLYVSALQGPLVALLQQHRADQPRDRAVVGEDAHHVLVRRLISAFSRSSGLVLWICSQCAWGKSMQASISCLAPSMRLPILSNLPRSWSSWSAGRPPRATGRARPWPILARRRWQWPH